MVKMRVCMISGMATHFGGVETVVDELSKYLGSKNFNINIYGRDKDNFIIKNKNIKVIGIKPFNYLPKPLQFAHYNKYAYSFDVWKKIKNKKFDIIHGHGDNCFFPSLIRGSPPFIVTFHGTLQNWILYNRSMGPRLLPVYYSEKIAALRCDIAIACSKAVKNELVTFYKINSKKVKVIYNGVDSDKYKPNNKNQAIKSLKLPSKYIYGIWVGSDPKRKGLSIAIKAVESLKRVRLLVVGVKAKNYGNVIFLGKVSTCNLINAYNAANFLVFPTISEGFPLVPLESLSCGVPIIVSKESNLGEIIKDGVHGFIVKDRNPLVYKEKIELMLYDSKLLKDMSAQCRNLAIDYSWKNQAEKYWRIYQELIETF